MDSDGKASVATTPRASGERDINNSVDGEMLRLRLTPKLRVTEFSGVRRTGAFSSESPEHAALALDYYTEYKSKNDGVDYAKYKFNVNKLDSIKGKQYTLEDDFLVATCLVGNECGGGDKDRADSKVLKRLKCKSSQNKIFEQDQGLPAQVPHWPPLLVGECEDLRWLSFRASASHGESHYQSASLPVRPLRCRFALTFSVTSHLLEF